MNLTRFLPLGLTLAWLGFSSQLRAAPTYTFLHEIKIGEDGGWDYLSIDADQRRLYVTHASRVVVIDLKTDKVIGEIAGTQGVHGVALAPDLGRGFVSNGGANTVSVVNLADRKTVATLSAGKNPDAILYAANNHEIYVFNGRSQSATVFSAQTNQLVMEIPLPGKPEFAAYDRAREMVYDAIEDKSLVVAIDGKQHQVVSTWPISPGESPTGVAFDPKRNRLFIGCDNSMLVDLDTDTGRVVGTIPIGEGVDAVAFDAANDLVFTSNGQSGTVTIAHVDSPDKLTVIQTLKTELGARTMAVDPVTHRIYLASAQFEKSDPSAAGHHRPKIVAGSFKVLVYSPDAAAAAKTE